MASQVIATAALGGDLQLALETKFSVAIVVTQTPGCRGPGRIFCCHLRSAHRLRPMEAVLESIVQYRPQPVDPVRERCKTADSIPSDLVAVAAERIGDGSGHGRLEHSRAAELTNLLRGFRNGQVAGAALAVLHLAAGGQSKSLLGRFVGFLFAHGICNASRPTGFRRAKLGSIQGAKVYRLTGNRPRGKNRNLRATKWHLANESDSGSAAPPSRHGRSPQTPARRFGQLGRER